MREIPGTVRSQYEAVISAKVQGQIEALHVVPGSVVSKGEVLAEIRANEITARYERAKAQRRQAEIEYERVQRLLQSNAVSEREFDSTDSAYKAASAALNEAETYLGYTQVTAPFDGIISEKLIEVGDLASPGVPLLSMYDPNHFRLEAKVPESLTNRMRLGNSYPVRIETLGIVLDGEIVEISPLADPSSRTVLVKVSLPAQSGVQSGQFGRLRIPVRGQEMLIVPAGSVISRGQLEYVYVVEQETPDAPRAWLRLIKTGRRVNGGVEVLSGLSGGERVITSAPSELQDGQPVDMES